MRGRQLGERLGVQRPARYTGIMFACSLRVRLVALAALSFAGLWGAPCAAHITLTEPVARSTDQGQQKANPCGGAAKTEPTELEAGSTITVRWNDGIPHPGWYVISFDPTGDDFDGDGDGTADYPAQSIDTAGTNSNGDGSLVLADNIDPIEFDGTRTPGDHEAEVTLPNTPCESCTLQLIQVMDDTGHPPGGSGTGHLYFRCADVRLVAPAGGSLDAGVGGTGGTGGGGAGPIGSGDAGSTPGGGGGEGGGGNPPVTPTASATASAAPPAMSSAPASSTSAPTAPAVTSALPSMSAPAPVATPSANASMGPVATPPAASSAATNDTSSDDEGGCSLQRRAASDGNNGVWALGVLLAGAALLRRSDRARAPKA